MDLVRSEAVVQLQNTDLVSALALSEPGILEYLVRADLRHVVPHDLHGTGAFECLRTVGSQCLRDDFNGLVFEAVGVNKVLRSHDDASCSILEEVSTCAQLCRDGTCRSRAAHELCEFIGDLGCIQHLLHAPTVPELRVRVVDRVLVVLRG